MIDLPDISTKQTKQIQIFIDDALEFNKTHNIFVRKSKEDVYAVSYTHLTLPTKRIV